MKKSLWMLGVALTALASCAETEVVDVPQTRAIGFTNAFVNNTTRADVTTDTFGKFWVFGDYDNDGSWANVFSNIEVTKGSPAWKPEQTAYWQLNKNYNFGAYADGTNTLSGFTQQQIGMYIATSAGARNVINTCEFEVGIAMLPVPEGTEAQGVYAGGGALCVAAGIDEATEAGVMEFFKYATSPELQATWAAGTGYYPISNGAYKTESMLATYEEYPQLKVSADQLLNSEVNGITAGPLLSQLPQLRTDLVVALESVFNGGDVDAAVEEAVRSTNAAIESANQGVA